MRQTSLEPGLLQGLRLYVIASAFLVPFIWRTFSSMLGIEAPFGGFLTPGIPVLMFLVFYVNVPWWERAMGRFFLPVALVLLGLQAIFGNYLTMQWLVPSHARELAALTFMTRVWVNIQFIVLFVAWQYELFWVMLAGIGLSLLDAALNFPFVEVNGGLYPFYAAIVLARMISVTVAGLGLAWLMKRQRQHRAALAEANRKLAQYAATTEQLAVSQERNRLARELHDTLAHSLSGVTVQLEAVEALWEGNTREARRMLDQALHSTRNGLMEARRALQSLRASPLEDLGLSLAVADLAKSAAARANLELDLNVQDHFEDIPLEIEQCVYRVAQEALTNITRHADAKSVHLSLMREHGELILTIADDGRGFDLHTVNSAHYGLRGLRERAEMISGVLDIKTRARQGTTIRLAIPIAKAHL
jgi:signal transduction histidine kinase